MLSKHCMIFKLRQKTIEAADPNLPFDIERFRVDSTPQYLAMRSLLHKAKIRQAVIERFIKLCRRMDSELEAELAVMSYRKFLDTDYWNYLRDYVVITRGMRCEKCGWTSNADVDGLEVHHISYDHRGSEWRYMEELKVLCPECHAQERSY